MVRFKHRYILCTLIFPDSGALDHLPRLATATEQSDAKIKLNDVDPPNPLPAITESAMIHLLRDSLSVNFGDVGAGEVGGTFSIKYLSPSTMTMIIRVSREHYQTLWASLTLLRKIGGKPVIVRVTHVSGTIRKVQHAAIRLDREQILTSHCHQLARKQRERRLVKRTTVDIDASTDQVEQLLQASEEKILALEA
ncbi:RNA-binding protein POP5 [Sporobolomyces koalae]|uniref:RNA-binding protein POP5 n=1 Tax=Sporobolomyces koalae TaxID=500713 RepID=UPI0031714725